MSRTLQGLFLSVMVTVGLVIGAATIGIAVAGCTVPTDQTDRVYAKAVDLKIGDGNVVVEITTETGDKVWYWVYYHDFGKLNFALNRTNKIRHQNHRLLAVSAD